MRRILFFFGFLSVFAGLWLATGISAGDVNQKSSETTAAHPNGPDSSCMACHSDAELLQELAEEEVLPEPPSEGSG